MGAWVGGETRVDHVLWDLEGRVLVTGGEGFLYGVLRSILRVVHEAEDFDAVAAYVEPAQAFVDGGYTAALQEVVQEHLLLLTSVELEGGMKLLLQRGSRRRAVGNLLVEVYDLILGEGLLAGIEIGRSPGVEVGKSSVILLREDLGVSSAVKGMIRVFPFLLA